MIKDRFGGLFSPLNKRDIQTLTDFEVFLQSAQAIEQEWVMGTYEYQLGDPKTPEDAFLFEVETPGEFVQYPLSEIYNYFQGLEEELRRQCNFQNKPIKTQFFDRQGWTDRLIDTKRRCRVWLSKITPILKKIKSAQHKLENEELS